MPAYIERLPDGRYEVGVPVQDGMDRWIKHTEAAAIASYRHAIAFNGRVRPEDVPVPAILDRRSWPVFATAKDGSATIDRDRIDDAVRLALEHARPGRRYELRVIAVELPGDPAFVGEGI